MMHRANKPLIRDLNQHLVCSLCKGYFINATTIIECLHTFCRGCIVRYLETNKYCPVCDVQVHKSKPLLNLRSDKIIQDIVYKLVPRLYANETQRRKDFYTSFKETKPTAFEIQTENLYQFLLSPEETLCLTLNHSGSNRKPRYLRCPAAVSVVHLQKLIKAKYDLSDNHRVDILYNQDCLNPTLTLMDVAYIYQWTKKSPLDFTYKIYEFTAKRIKLDKVDDIVDTPQTNNSNWKEVQLRISENGEMSITGIQDTILDVTCENYDQDLVELIDTKTSTASTSVKKKELPGLKYIGKMTTSNSKLHILSNELISPTTSSMDYNNYMTNNTIEYMPVNMAAFNSANTTTVFSTINTSKCSTSIDETATRTCDVKNAIAPAQNACKKSQNEALKGADKERGTKRKSQDNQVDVVQTKKMQTALKSPIAPNTTKELNHVGGGDKEQKNETKANSTVDHKEPTVEPSRGDKIEKEESIGSKKEKLDANKNEKVEDVFTKPNFVNKNMTNMVLNRPGTPIATTKLSPVKYPAHSQPCYMPRTAYNPVINVPKVTPSTSATRCDVKSPKTVTSGAKNDTKIIATSAASSPPVQSTTPCATNNNNKINIKTKPSTPIGYKTLRDPPKSWNSQISKANLNKPAPDPKYSDLKNVRPAKFFKMRNNMPRYLGNPASGVKPMYSVHISPEKEKIENREIKKHSIVKIDPKTLKPISEKAPELTSLSNHSGTSGGEMQINVSTVSIFNPLKLQQQNSSKNERKSPKSPHSPKTTKSVSPPIKRDKLSLNFTPSNPFVPNLSSQTVSPNQFLCPTGPAGFPSYDPRMMAAYHTFLYDPRMGFPPPPMPCLNLDFNQRKSFDMGPPSSPKQPQPYSPKSFQSRLNPTNPPASKPQTVTKKTPKDQSKSEKSLQTAVERLTQNRAKEIVRNATNNTQPSVDRNSVSNVKTDEARDEKKPLDKGNTKNLKMVKTERSEVKSSECDQLKTNEEDSKTKVSEETETNQRKNEPVEVRLDNNNVDEEKFGKSALRSNNGPSSQKVNAKLTDNNLLPKRDVSSGNCGGALKNESSDAKTIKSPIVHNTDNNAGTKIENKSNKTNSSEKIARVEGKQ